MTIIATQEKRQKSKAERALLSVISLAAVLIFAFFISGAITENVIDGARFALLTIIPTAYPFMIVGDIYLSFGTPERIRPLTKLITRALGISAGGIAALVCGTVSGFPLGAKISAELYTGGGISKKEAEVLSAISNNPSIPFVTAVVGNVLFESKKTGVLLLIIIYISTIITANIFRVRKGKNETARLYRPPFSFTKSVTGAALSSLNITAFVTLFFAIIGILSFIFPSRMIIAFISSFLEVTTAVKSISSLSLPLAIRLSLASFALGFGGLSVMMQSSIFLSGAGLRLRKYFFVKLTEGVISFILTFVSCILFPSLIS